MANSKRYLSTEVSVHQLELEFVIKHLELDEALAELYYWLDHVPETLRPEAQRLRGLVQSRFFGVMQAARAAEPFKRRNNNGI